MLRLLMKSVQHKNRLGETRDVNYPIGTRCVSNSYFADALSDRRHRLPVVRIKPALHTINLITGLAASPLRKGANLFKRISKKNDRLH